MAKIHHVVVKNSKFTHFSLVQSLPTSPLSMSPSFKSGGGAEKMVRTWGWRWKWRWGETSNAAKHPALTSLK